MIKEAADAQIKSGGLKPREAADLVDRYEAVLSEYTYVDHLPSADENKILSRERANGAIKPAELV